MELPTITLSINPLYYCNMSCSWCYLTQTQLTDKATILPLHRLEEIILDVMRLYKITHVDLYGGEITLLPEAYQRDLYEMLLFYNIPSINAITNYTRPNAFILNAPKVSLTVSYDGTVRENHERVYRNMMLSTKPLSVLTLASRKFLDTVNVNEYVQMMNMISTTTVEIKPYSSNQSNQDTVKYTEYEQFVLDVLDHPDRTFHLNNEEHITEALSGNRNSFSNDHLYITPTGDMAILDFDADGNEYFDPVKDLDAYHEWTQREVIQTDQGLCGTCEYRGRCLSEHLRVVTDLTDSCNGFYNLLKVFDV